MAWQSLQGAVRGLGEGMLTRSPRLFLSRASSRAGGRGAQVISGSLAGLSLPYNDLAFMGLFF